MGFRGVLLHMGESDTESSTSASSTSSNGAFRIVAPDAELALPSPHERPRSDSSLAAVTNEVFVVTDRVSTQLLQIASCTSVLLQRETHSALWVATLSSQRVASIVATPTSTNGRPTESQPPEQLSLVPRATLLHENDNRNSRSCCCFQFRSHIEFDLFARAVDALVRTQQLALLEHSVLLELEIERELTQQQQLKAQRLASSSATVAAAVKPTTKDAKPPKSRTQGSATATSRSVQRSRPVSTAAPATSSKARAVAADAPTACILCRTTEASGAQLSLHPFVLQDARGDKCHVCRVCMQQMLQRRVQVQPSAAQQPGARDRACGLCCQQPTAQLKACAAPQCPRVFCAACLKKLVGKAQSHKVQRTKHWQCPNCTTYDAAASSSDGKSLEQDAATDGDTAPARKSQSQSSTDDVAKRKRKRQVGDAAASGRQSIGPQQSPPNGSSDSSDKTPIAAAAAAAGTGAVDYAANYFAFLLAREGAKVVVADPSEDVCFCCKDGGDLIECDWPGREFRYARCPKVYHEDCLGYSVPETFEWKCPRHRCQTCGAIAHFACRFCVTSFCEVHVPAEIEKLGPATRDIPDATYVLCAACKEQADRSVAAGTLTAKTRAQICKLPAKRK